MVESSGTVRRPNEGDGLLIGLYLDNIEHGTAARHQGDRGRDGCRGHVGDDRIGLEERVDSCTAAVGCGLDVNSERCHGPGTMRICDADAHLASGFDTGRGPHGEPHAVPATVRSNIRSTQGSAGHLC